MKRQKALEELERRRAIAIEMGGPEKIAKHRKRGHITARERIDALLDPGSFTETGQLGLFQLPGSDKLYPASKLHGHGRIDSRLVTIQSDDSTVLAGTGSHGFHRGGGIDGVKSYNRPIVRFGESGGVHLQSVMGSIGILGSATVPFGPRVSGRRKIPRAVGMMGYCFGDPTWAAADSEFVVQVKGTCMAVSGPRVLTVALSEQTTPEELGGWKVHACTTGQVDAFTENDEEAAFLLRKFISYMPQNNEEETPRVPTDDPVDRAATRAGEVIPDTVDRIYEPYDMEEVIQSIVDDGESFVLKPFFAPSLLVCFARLNGFTVGIIANQPLNDGGAIGPDECDKATDMIVMCDSFNIPLLFLCDVPGYSGRKDAEEQRLPVKANHWLDAISMITVPHLTAIVRKAHGAAATLMNATGEDYILALSTADLRPMADEMALKTAAIKSRIEAAEDPDTEREMILAEFDENADPFQAAMNGQVDDVVVPEDLRERIISILRLTDEREGSGSFISAHKMQNWPTGF